MSSFITFLEIWSSLQLKWSYETTTRDSYVPFTLHIIHYEMMKVFEKFKEVQNHKGKWGEWTAAETIWR